MKKPQNEDVVGKIYALPALIKSQQNAHTQHCFGDCGKVSVAGAIEIQEVGPCWVCTVTSCPYEKGVIGPVGSSQWTGDEVYIRALLPVEVIRPLGVL